MQIFVDSKNRYTTFFLDTLLCKSLFSTQLRMAHSSRLCCMLIFKPVFYLVHAIHNSHLRSMLDGRYTYSMTINFLFGLSTLCRWYLENFEDRVINS